MKLTVVPENSAASSRQSVRIASIYSSVRLPRLAQSLPMASISSLHQPTPTPTVLGVKHLGDVKRGGNSDINEETLEIVMSDEIDQIAVVAYSAQSNGTGSFKKYQVSLAVDNGAGTKVTVDADQANSHNNVYTCVPAIIKNTADGVAIERVEMYSKPGSELRPSFVGATKQGLFGKAFGAAAVAGQLTMDAGSKNLFK